MKAQEIADFLSVELVGDGSVEIERVASLSAATAGDIAFIDKADSSISTNASCLIVPIDLSARVSQPYIQTQDPKLAFTLVAELLRPAKDRPGEIHPSAV